MWNMIQSNISYMIWNMNDMIQFNISYMIWNMIWYNPIYHTWYEIWYDTIQYIIHGMKCGMIQNIIYLYIYHILYRIWRGMIILILFFKLFLDERKFWVLKVTHLFEEALIAADLWVWFSSPSHRELGSCLHARTGLSYSLRERERKRGGWGSKNKTQNWTCTAKRQRTKKRGLKDLFTPPKNSNSVVSNPCNFISLWNTKMFYTMMICTVYAQKTQIIKVLYVSGSCVSDAFHSVFHINHICSCMNYCSDIFILLLRCLWKPVSTME